MDIAENAAESTTSPTRSGALQNREQLELKIPYYRRTTDQSIRLAMRGWHLSFRAVDHLSGCHHFQLVAARFQPKAFQ